MDRHLAAKFNVVPTRRSTENRFLNRMMPLIRLYRFVRQEWRPAVQLPIIKRLRSWRLGFFSKSYVLFDFDRNDPSQYVQDAKVLNYTINDPHRLILHNKLSFSLLMQLYGMPHPRVFGFLHEGCFHSNEEEIASGSELSVAIATLLDRYAGLVLKPTHLGMGMGIMLVRRERKGVTVNGVSAPLNELIRFIEPLEHYYISEFARQATYAGNLFPDTPNTVRVLSLWDFDNNEPFLAAASHRIGSARVFPVDNFHQGFGGMAAKINLDSGILGPAIWIADNKISWLSHHPETGAPIEGTKVQHWEDTKAKLLDVSSKIPQVPFIGWDMIITEQGCRCIEANCPPGLAPWQAQEPLLADPRCRRFFELMGMTARR